MLALLLRESASTAGHAERYSWSEVSIDSSEIGSGRIVRSRS
jgi:hypothetical protein